MGQAQTAVVIGGGIIGVTGAYALARDGWQVQLVDRLPQVAMGASWGNGRQLSYSHTNALANPALRSQIPNLLLGNDDAFRMHLRPDVALLGWLTRFMCNSTASAYRKNTLATLALADHSRAAMEALLSRHTIDFDQRKVGKIVLLRGDKEVRSARQSMEMKRNAGLRQMLVDAEEAAFLEPALAQAPERVTAALYSPDDETGDCVAFARRLCEISQQDYGLKLIAGRDVVAIKRGRGETRVSLDNGEEIAADLVVVSSGSCTNRLLKPLGHRVQIEPIKGYSFTAPIGNAPPRVSITDNKRRIVFTNLGDKVLVAGIAEIGNLDRDVDFIRLTSMQEAARASLPEAADYSRSANGWAGFRPATPDSRPIIRKLEPGIAVNAGHGMLGWTMAMGSAERLSAIVAAD